ncbi:nuclear transport factor 2 family protein [bacterium]|nr:MAG: nuclear transport factor 2 family protein [bacterium]
MDLEVLMGEIEQYEQRLLAAQLASDVGALDGLIADELVFVDLAGQLATKAMDLESHRAGLLKLTRSELLGREVRFVGVGAAATISLVAMSGSFGGAEFEGQFRYTRVWEKRGEGWVIVAGHISAVAS